MSPKVKCGRHVSNTKFNLDPKQLSVWKLLFILRTVRVPGAQVCETFWWIQPFVLHSNDTWQKNCQIRVRSCHILTRLYFLNCVICTVVSTILYIFFKKVHIEKWQQMTTWQHFFLADFISEMPITSFILRVATHTV